jgi:hypothetical protein
MTLGLHLSSLLGSVSPSVSVSSSMSASVLPCPCQVGGGAQCSGSRCGLTQAAGSEAQEGKEPAAPGHRHTPGHTQHSQKHTMTKAQRWLPEDFYRDVHTGTKTAHTATPRNTQGYQSFTCRYHGSHTHRDMHYSKGTHTSTQPHIPGHSSRGKPRAMNTQNIHTPSGTSGDTQNKESRRNHKVEHTNTRTQVHSIHLGNHSEPSTARATEANEHRQA